MYNHLINFIDKNTILCYISIWISHYPNHATIFLVEKVNNAIDSGKISIGVFF